MSNVAEKIEGKRLGQEIARKEDFDENFRQRLVLLRIKHNGNTNNAREAFIVWRRFARH